MAQVKGGCGSSCTSTAHSTSLVPLEVFVEEILARSRTTGAVLKVALHYVEVLRPKVANTSTSTLVPNGEFYLRSRTAFKTYIISQGQAQVDAEIHHCSRLPSPLLCPRRVFLAALILASKFVEDISIPNREWARLAGLPVWEVVRCERAVGEALDWRLWILSSSTVKARLDDC